MSGKAWPGPSPDLLNSPHVSCWLHCCKAKCSAHQQLVQAAPAGQRLFWEGPCPPLLPSSTQPSHSHRRARSLLLLFLLLFRCKCSLLSFMQVGHAPLNTVSGAPSPRTGFLRHGDSACMELNSQPACRSICYLSAGALSISCSSLKPFTGQCCRWTGRCDPGHTTGITQEQLPTSPEQTQSQGGETPGMLTPLFLQGLHLTGEGGRIFYYLPPMELTPSCGCGQTQRQTTCTSVSAGLGSPASPVR